MDYFQKTPSIAVITIAFPVRNIRATQAKAVKNEV